MPSNYHTDGPETERLAYHSRISPRKSELQKIVYRSIRDTVPFGGSNGDDVIRHTHLLDYTARPRITELRDLGLITCVGKKDNQRGNSELLYVPTDPGLDYEAALERFAPNADTGTQSQGSDQQGYRYAGQSRI